METNLHVYETESDILLKEENSDLFYYLFRDLKWLQSLNTPKAMGVNTKGWWEYSLTVV